MSNNVINLRGIKELPKNAPKNDRATMDTAILTVAAVEAWKRPPFQREFKLTERVQALIGVIRREESIDGVITLGKLDGETYLLDGQHRTNAFKMACDPDYVVKDEETGQVIPPIKEALADLRMRTFGSMGEMSQEFVNLNRALVAMRTDDLVRGLAEINPHIAAIRKRCPFVGYDHVRTDTGKTLVSMASTIRTWFGSAGDTPSPGPSSMDAVNMLNEDQVEMLTNFLSDCFDALGREKENYRLWGSLTQAILMWLYRRLVLHMGLPQYRGGTRIVELTRAEFKQCLMALAADRMYVDWLLGRALRDRDRGPAYARIRAAFVRALSARGNTNPRFPSPEWASR